MNQYHTQQTAVIEAPADQLYAIIADYHQGHRAILPARYFTELIVNRGGFGAGTAVTVHMNVFGTRLRYEMEISEPEPGQTLVEEDKEAGVKTTFHLQPIDDRERTRVTISTTAVTSSGLRGILEKAMNPVIMRRIYRAELQKIAQMVREQSA